MEPVKPRQPAHDQACERLNAPSRFFIEQCKRLDWSEAIYRSKLQRVAVVIKAMPSLTDVIVIPETEKALDDLVSQHLAGYEVI